MKSTIKILWSLVFRPGSTFSRRLCDAAERMDFRVSQADADAEADVKRAAEDVLREQAVLLAAAQRIGRMGCWRMHIRSNRLVWSDATCELFRIAPEEFAGTYEFFQSFIVEDDLAAFVATRALISPSNPSWEAEYRIRWRDGQIRMMHERGVAEFDSAGDCVSRIGMMMDITERKVSEDKLRKNLSVLRIAGNIAWVGSWLMNVADHKLYWSEEVWNLLGLPRGKEPSLEEGLNLYAPESKTKLGAALASCGSDGTPFDLDLELRNAKGQKMWARICGEAERDADGVITWVNGAFSDISERKVLDDSLLLLNSAVEQVKESILITDAGLDLPGPAIIFVNQAFTTMTGYAPEEVIGKTPRILQGPLTDQEMLARLRRNLSSEETFQGETVNYRKDGTSYQVEWQISPLRNASGTTTHYVAIQRDITERKQAEEELLWKTALLEAQIDSYGVGILVVDDKGRKILQNRRSVDLWQIPPELAESDDDNAQLQYVIGRTAQPKQFSDKVTHLYAHPDEHSSDEIELIDGTVLDRHSAPVIGKDGRNYGRLWTFADITARKHREIELIELNRQLLDVSRQAGMAEVATNVLHNVGNVLNTVNISCSVILEKIRKSRISGVVKTAELLENHQGDLTAFFTADAGGRKLPEYLGKLADQLVQEQAAISAELQSLSGNIDHIKVIVAMQQNLARAQGATEIVAIADLIEDGLRLSEKSLNRHQVRIVREYCEAPPVVVEKHRVLQILVNLIDNAKSACDESGRADQQITLRLTVDGETVRIVVIDNGLGIPPENLERIFTYGFTTKADGHGFGLHGSILAVREMEGDLTVQSDGPGKGATFSLSLPITPP